MPIPLDGPCAGHEEAAAGHEVGVDDDEGHGAEGVFDASCSASTATVGVGSRRTAEDDEAMGESDGNGMVVG